MAIFFVRFLVYVTADFRFHSVIEGLTMCSRIYVAVVNRKILDCSFSRPIGKFILLLPVDLMLENRLEMAAHQDGTHFSTTFVEFLIESVDFHWITSKLVSNCKLARGVGIYRNSSAESTVYILVGTK